MNNELIDDTLEAKTAALLETARAVCEGIKFTIYMDRKTKYERLEVVLTMDGYTFTLPDAWKKPDSLLAKLAFLQASIEGYDEMVEQLADEAAWEAEQATKGDGA